MQTTLKVQISSPTMGMARAPRSTRLACRCHLSSQRSSSAALEQASLALAASMLPLAATLPGFAEEVAATPAATDAAAAVAGRTEVIFGMSATELAVSFTPVVIYGLFSVYREKVNPRAKLGDLVFIIAALVVFGNIFSLLIFKQRIY